MGILEPGFFIFRGRRWYLGTRPLKGIEELGVDEGGLCEMQSRRDISCHAEVLQIGQFMNIALMLPYLLHLVLVSMLHHGKVFGE